MACFNTCLTCFNSDFDKCLTCDTTAMGTYKYFYDTDLNGNGECVIACPTNNFYPDGFVCKACSANC